MVWAIGLAFQINTAAGIAVALAVIAHDFSDGLNTVSLLLANKNTAKRAKIFLLIVSIAPVLGALLSSSLVIAPSILIAYLAFFAGFLLYIGASDILPEAHSHGPSKTILALTIVGAAFIFAVTQVIPG
jgi:zinc transporter ZupT